MSAFKKLNKQDTFISDYIARKQWNTTGSLLSDYNIEVLRGFEEGTIPYSYPNDNFNNRSQELIYKSIKHLFYEGSLGQGHYTGSRDLSLQSSLNYSGSRNIQNEIAVFSLPKNLIGTHIEPKSLTIDHERLETGSGGSGSDQYVNHGYISSSTTSSQEYIEDINYWYTFPGSTFSGSALTDDGDGNVIYTGSNTELFFDKQIVGDIIYNQGIVVLTNPVIARYYSTYARNRLRWKSNLPIYTYNINCKVKDSEMNLTYNPSVYTGSTGQLNDNITGSDFSPFFTSVGLYNDANQLLAVAKTGRPIPKSNKSDTTVVVKIDI